MTLFQSILLGIIQGFTEFLPISSSAHLVLTPYLLGWNFSDQAEFIFDVLVQLGTLVAVIAYFRKDLISIARSFILGIWHKKPLADTEAKLGWYLILATLPAILAGIFLKNLVERAFSSPTASAFFLLVTAAFLLAAEWVGHKTRNLDQLKGMDAIFIGLSQVASLFPGVSRSGTTISAGLMRNLDRKTAARFSFLMSVPVMLGAGGLAVIDLFRLPDFTSQLPTLLIGFLTAAVVGYLSIRWLLNFLSRRTFTIFAIYCLLLSLTTIGVSIIRGIG